MRRTRVTRLAIAALVLGLPLWGPPAAADSSTSSATTAVVLAEQTKARKIADPDPLIAVNVLEDGLQGSCRLHAVQGADDRKGVKGIFQATLVDANTLVEIADFGKTKKRTDRNGQIVVDYPIPQQGNFAQQVALVAAVDVKGGKKVTEIHFSCQLVDATP